MQTRNMYTTSLYITEVCKERIGVGPVGCVVSCACLTVMGEQGGKADMGFTWLGVLLRMISVVAYSF